MSGADPRSYTAALGPNQAFFVSTYFKQLNLHPSSQDTIGRADEAAIETHALMPSSLRTR